MTRRCPIVYTVERIRDGRSFTTRRVVAIQHGQGDLRAVGVVPACRRPASTIRRRCRSGPSPDADARRARPPRCVTADAAASRPGPSTAAGCAGRRADDRPPTADLDEGDRPAARRSAPARLRADLRLRPDPGRRPCARMHGIDGRTHDVRTASLDHAVWFHRPFRVDEWLLYESRVAVGLGCAGPGDRPDLHRRRAPGRDGRCKRAMIRVASSRSVAMGPAGRRASWRRPASSRSWLGCARQRIAVDDDQVGRRAAPRCGANAGREGLADRDALFGMPRARRSSRVR